MSNLPKAGNSVVTTKTTKDEYIAASRFGGMEWKVEMIDLLFDKKSRESPIGFSGFYFNLQWI